MNPNGMYTTATADPPIVRVLDRLKGVRETRNGWDACCPAHDDVRPSLGVAAGDDGRVLLHCRSQGCTVEQITAAIGLTVSDLYEPAFRFPARAGKARDTARRTYTPFTYRDAGGNVLFQWVRGDLRPVPRRRRQRRRDGPGDRSAAPHPRRPAAGGAHPRGHSGARHAAEPARRFRDGRARPLPAHRSSASRRPRRRRGRSRRPRGVAHRAAWCSAKGSTICRCARADGRVRLLRREGDRVREVTSETGWPGYNGEPGGNRYTTLTQIDKTQRRAARAGMDVHRAQRRRTAGHAGRSSTASCT